MKSRCRSRRSSDSETADVPVTYRDFFIQAPHPVRCPEADEVCIDVPWDDRGRTHRDQRRWSTAGAVSVPQPIALCTCCSVRASTELIAGIADGHWASFICTRIRTTARGQGQRGQRMSRPAKASRSIEDSAQTDDARDPSSAQRGHDLEHCRRRSDPDPAQTGAIARSE